MTLINPTAATGMFLNSGLEKLANEHPKNIEQEKARLRKASKEFESLFMYQMLKAMRKTVGDNPLTKGMPFSNDLGKDTFTDMFDMQLAQKMVTGDRGSIADLLYKSLASRLEKQTDVEESPQPLKPLHPPEPGPIKLNKKILEMTPPQKSFPLKITHQPLKLRSDDRLKRKANNDDIITKYGPLIDEAAQETGLDSALIYAVIKAESDGNPKVESSAGAKGLMQLMDSTADEMGVTHVFDPRQNILNGSRYLKRQFDRFGDTRLALAAYNAGPENVKRFNGEPPFPETKGYIERVLSAVKSYRQIINGESAKAP